ncbi:hypothetical protein OEZ86_013124 [Tetradesmus obliquus]|nr:hypothetical protein OEZ86_013124 [Tetradesmus obliquus]
MDAEAADGSLAALRPLQHANIGIFGWGRNDCGQLGFCPDQGSSSCANCSSNSSGSSGLPGVVAAVSRMPLLDGRPVMSAAASLFNTALLTADGELYMLGDNDSGLLGRRAKPAADTTAAAAAAAAAADFSWTAVRVEALEPHPLADVAIGQAHALAVTQQGLLATWGCNDSGQLGLGSVNEHIQHNPKLLRGSATASSSSPDKDNLRGAADGLLAGDRRKRAAGDAGGSGSSNSNSYSPVAGGHGGSSSSSTRMAFVRCAVGANNSLALSSSGRCFTFGQGNHGVLGVRGLSCSPSPVHVPGLWEVGVLQIAAGEAHCAALGANGFAYTWGRGKYGQLGHGSFEDEEEPRQISSVSEVASVITGDQHTLLLARHPPDQASTHSSHSSSTQAYAFGRGTFGATGLGLLLLLFKADSNTQQQQQQQQRQQVLPAHGLDLHRIESTYTLLLKSYAREVVGALGAASVRLLQDLPDTAGWGSGASNDAVAVLFVLLQSPLNSDVHGLGGVLLGLLTVLVLKLNSSSLRMLLGWLGQLKPEVFAARVVRPVQALLTRFAKDALQHAGAPPGARPGLGQARGDALLLARLLDVLHAANVQAGELVPYSEFANSAVSATVNLHEEYYTWLQSGAYKQPYEDFQAAASRAISAAHTKPTHHTTAAAAASGGNHSSSSRSPQQRQDVPLSTGSSSSSSGAKHKRMFGGGGGGAVAVPAVPPGGSVSSLCELPFLLTTEAKSNILRDEAALQQQHVVHASAMAALLQGLPPGGMAAAGGAAAAAAAGAGDPLSLSLSLRVRRGHEMEDALKQIRSCGPQELKKPLRVTFLSEDGAIAEEGVDQGGVSREFFQLLVGQLLSADYGMFLHVEESRACWFNPASMESLDEFELVGIVLGLACYNGVIIDAHLPLPAYKKLMGLAPCFADLALLYPSLHNGLQQLLDFDGDVETTFCRCFEVEYEAFGAKQTVELMPGGSSMPVNSENRSHFVQLYTAWLLSGGVADQFAAFASGFHRVCGGPALSLFRYEEVELLVEGLPHLDFKQLQAGARYEGGYSAGHTTIAALWSVLLALPVDEQRAFLQFCTGCDRAPVAGLGALRLLVQRAGPDSEKLPTAHTCFNTLLLPEYCSRAKLQRKLMTAIQNAQGFGLQ